MSRDGLYISKRSLKKAINKMNAITHFTLYMYAFCDLHRLMIPNKKINVVLAKVRQRCKV